MLSQQVVLKNMMTIYPQKCSFDFLMFCFLSVWVWGHRSTIQIRVLLKCYYCSSTCWHTNITDFLFIVVVTLLTQYANLTFLHHHCRERNLVWQKSTFNLFVILVEISICCIDHYRLVALRGAHPALRAVCCTCKCQVCPGGGCVIQQMKAAVLQQQERCVFTTVGCSW